METKQQESGPEQARCGTCRRTSTVTPVYGHVKRGGVNGQKWRVLCAQCLPKAQIDRHDTVFAQGATPAMIRTTLVGYIGQSTAIIQQASEMLAQPGGERFAFEAWLEAEQLDSLLYALVSLPKRWGQRRR